MLKGTNVTLRALTRQDIARAWEFSNDITTHALGSNCPPFPLSLESMQAQFDASLREEKPSFAIEVNSTYIGGCCLSTFDQMAHSCEILISIGDPEYRGRGYGREAISLLVDYAFDFWNLRKVWLTVFGSNERAIRCYRACGFVEEGRLQEHVWSGGRYEDLIYMAVFRETK